MKTSRAVILTIIAVLLAIYILFPFFLVVLNSFKTQAAIVQDPISAAGASFKQFASNLNNVVNNKNFVFWHAFGSSAVVTIISLILLAVFGGMAAWVICRNKTKWSTVIYMVFISSMIIPFQVVMLPLVATFREVGKFVGLVSIGHHYFSLLLTSLLLSVATLAATRCHEHPCCHDGETE
jgi:raffinose/stachyose/melibiose transport system permease protein